MGKFTTAWAGVELGLFFKTAFVRKQRCGLVNQVGTGQVDVAEVFPICCLFKKYYSAKMHEFDYICTGKVSVIFFFVSILLKYILAHILI